MNLRSYVAVLMFCSVIYSENNQSKKILYDIKNMNES